MFLDLARIQLLQIVWRIKSLLLSMSPTSQKLSSCSRSFMCILLIIYVMIQKLSLIKDSNSEIHKQTKICISLVPVSQLTGKEDSLRLPLEQVVFLIIVEVCEVRWSGYFAIIVKLPWLSILLPSQITKLYNEQY